MRRTVKLVVIVIMLMLMISHTASAQYRIPWSAVASGGGPLLGSPYRLGVIVGQAATGNAQSSRHRLALGYLSSSRFVTNVEETCPELPTAFALFQNYPNPFNPVTNFQFSVVNYQLTILKVYDVLGRDVATLVNEVKQPGTYTVRWDAEGSASGVYFCRLQSGPSVQTRTLVLLK